MEEVINHLISVASGLAILGAGYVVWLASGIANVIFTPDLKWSWGKFFKGLAKALIMALTILSWVAVFDALDWFTKSMGADISSVLNGASVSGLVGGIIGGTAYFLAKGYRNFYDFINPSNAEVVVENPDYAKVASDMKKLAEAITPVWTVNEKQSDEEAAKKAAEKYGKAGKGDDVNPLTRRLPDGDTDGGKGWQCTKYSYYLTTGIRMNYPPHPDYGPCNGRDMVDYLVENCGYVRCGKINGAIFSYECGEYGHTGMVVDAQQNIVSNANYVPLTVSTNYINLEAVGATYCCPPSMKPAPTPTPTPTPTPAPSSFKVGDKVVPTALIDYNGTPLIQWDDCYTISELNGDRAVLTAPRNGKPVVWAAMNTANLRKI